MFPSVISTDSDFSANALTLDFLRIVPGARACAITTASGDSILEGPEVFGFQILQDPNLPDVVIFHNDIRVILNDDGNDDVCDKRMLLWAVVIAPGLCCACVQTGYHACLYVVWVNF